jgi:hypothetical protein
MKELGFVFQTLGREQRLCELLLGCYLHCFFVDE